MTLPVFDKKIILDYNSDGLDSVESDDFDAGFGCVPKAKEYVQPLPPELPKKRISKIDQDNWRCFTMSEEQRRVADDEHLAKHGIL